MPNLLLFKMIIFPFFAYFSVIAGGVPQGVALDAESVSISSSTTSGGRMPGARQILGLALPGLRSSGSRGASLEKSAVEEIPDQLRTPAVPQVSQIEPHWGKYRSQVFAIFSVKHK